MEWYRKQTAWSEPHSYESVELTSQNLKNWFMEMKDIFPPMNGEYAPSDELLSENEDLEDRLTDYCIGYDIIYMTFAWSFAEEAYDAVRSLAEKYDVGFFDVSGNEEIII